MLRQAKLRVTRPRLAVLAEVEATPHSDAESIRAGVSDRLGNVSTQAVYDILHAFTDAGIVRRLEPAGSPARYEVAAGDNHHHLVCRGCGAVVDVSCAIGAAPCLQPSDDHGFRVETAEVLYWGYCPRCQSTPGT
ncbi:Fur family transcriptional regulator [Prauserella oleivorans]|uniref:Fur family transcriptional regulator n=1 Tax=Prauserella oleivorans TaxID=1478153 RepID=A0ABW5W6Q2_9PSEU